MQAADRKRWMGLLAEMLAIALAYWALARLGQFVAIEPGNVTPVWPPSGLALAIVLRRGYRVWPALWLGNFLGNTHAFVDISTLPAAYADPGHGHRYRAGRRAAGLPGGVSRPTILHEHGTV